MMSYIFTQQLKKNYFQIKIHFGTKISVIVASLEFLLKSVKVRVDLS